MQVIIRPVLDCNISCSYCYASNSMASSKIMNLDDAIFVIDQVHDYAMQSGEKTIQFLWHGGEPLLWNVDNYRTVFDYIKEKFVCVKYNIAIQTNLISLSENFISLFKTYNVAVSSSLDGPKYIHDVYRRTKNNRGTFEIVFKNIKRLQDAGIKVNIVSVGTALNITEVRPIYNFMNQNKLGFRIGPIIKSSSTDNAYDSYSITQEEYAAAMIELFDIWTKDEKTNINISFFSEIAGNIVTGKPSSCSYKKNCSSKFISIDPNCNVYPCCFFYGDKNFFLGNMKDVPLYKIMTTSPVFNYYKEREEYINEECKECKYIHICNGGCPHAAYSIYGTFKSLTNLCESYKKIFSHIEAYLLRNNIITKANQASLKP